MKDRIVQGIVVVVVVLLLTFLFVKMAHIHSLPKNRVRSIAKMEKLGHAINEYRAVSNRCPSSLDVLIGFEPAAVFLSTNSNPFADAWGRDFIYEISGTNFTLRSLGKDGKRGTKDDIQRL